MSLHNATTRCRGLATSAALAVLGIGALAAFPASAGAADCSAAIGSTNLVTATGGAGSEPGEAVTISLVASPAASYTWSAAGLPPGVALDGGTGAVSGAAPEGTYEVTFTAQSADAACSLGFTWFVNDAEAGPGTPTIPPSTVPSESTTTTTTTTPSTSPPGPTTTTTGATTTVAPGTATSSSTTSPGATTTTIGPSTNPGNLAFTGGDVAGTVAIGLGAIGVGGALVWSQRRRRQGA